MASLEAGINFDFSSQEGAVLVLPDGASREDLHEYMKQDFYNRLTDEIVLQWLEFARAPSIVLVTGWAKSRSWAVAAVSNSSKDRSMSLKFSAVKASGGFFASFRWESSSPGHVRAGPSTPSVTDNQCIFLRGFRLSSRKSFTHPGKLKRKISDITGSKIPDFRSTKRGGAASRGTDPSGSGNSSGGGTSRGGGPPIGNNRNQNLSGDAGAEGYSSEEDEVIVESLTTVSQVSRVDPCFDASKI